MSFITERREGEARETAGVTIAPRADSSSLRRPQINLLNDERLGVD